MSGRGWFKLPTRDGDRTLAEQMTGLEHALAEAKGKSVLDLGSAEGLIAFEFAKAGAREVRCIEFNADLVRSGEEELARLGPFPAVRFEVGEVVQAMQKEPRRYDIVLALAILHKLRDPVEGIRLAAQSTGSLLVVRLPIGSTGYIRSKFAPHNSGDLREVLTAEGFKLERKTNGPRDEQVRYWRRG